MLIYAIDSPVSVVRRGRAGTTSRKPPFLPALHSLHSLSDPSPSLVHLPSPELQDAYEQLSSWKQDIDRYTVSANCILVCTKSDLPDDERRVEPHQAKVSCLPVCLLHLCTTLYMPFGRELLCVRRGSVCMYAHQVPLLLLELSLQAYARNMHIPYIETSAKTGSNVTEAFASLVREMQYSCDSENTRSIKVDIPNPQQRKPGCC